MMNVKEFLITDDACKITQFNVQQAMRVLKASGLNPKKNPQLLINLLSQMYSLESILQGARDMGEATSQACGSNCGCNQSVQEEEGSLTVTKD